MTKPRPAYADMIDLPDDPVETPANPAPEPVAEPVKPATKAETIKPTRQRKDSSVPSRREAARLRRMEPKPEPADYAQRSLYAREETFERFRQLAFTNKTTAQALYREGLFMVLEKYGASGKLTQDDM